MDIGRRGMKLKVGAVLLIMGALVITRHDGHVLAADSSKVGAAAAMKALDEYMTAFNSRDEKAWAATLNYPHVRIAGGKVKVWNTPEDYCADFDFDAFAKQYNWDHSAWDKREIVQQGPGKVHVCVTFSR